MRIFFQLLAGLLLIVAVAAFDMNRVLDTPLTLDQPTTLLIEDGQSFTEVVRNMATRKILPATPRSLVYLRLYARMTGLGRRMKSGEFQLQPSMSVRQAIQLFESGKTVLYELRFIEGWTFAEAMSALRQDPQIRHTLDANADNAQIMQRLGRAGSAAEGRLFPDTYRFPRGTTDIAFLKRAADTMDRVLAEEWDGRAPNLPYEDANQALVMASIVEKETADAGERSRIAGVFVRRLQQGMRLQTDPTVIYGLGSRFDGNLRLRDLRADTPFNTYTRAGLPPTPICLPSRASIHAAMHPDDGKALFFVSRGDGTHEFSETLRQHEAAVRRYQLRKR